MPLLSAVAKVVTLVPETPNIVISLLGQQLC